MKNKNKIKYAQKEYGFSLTEVLIAMAITLVILAAALAGWKSMTDTGAAAAKVSEINSDIQASLNLIRLDLYKVGGDGILPEEIMINGNWQGNRCIRGGSVTNNCDNPVVGDIVLLKGTPDDGGGYVFDGITPGLANGHSAMSVVFLDDFARGINTTIKTADGLSLEVIPGDAKNTRKFSAIRQGDIVFLRRGFRVALQHVTGKTSTTISFASDTTGMNQSLIASGLGGLNDEVEVQLMRRVTYYLDTVPVAGNPAWLMRQVNFRPAVQLIPGVLGFQLTYELIDKTAGGIQEINIAPGTRGSRQAGTKYSIDVDVQNNKEYFDDNPRRTIDIRRVNVNIWADSVSPAIQGGDKNVLLDQTARIALRGYGDFIEPDPCVVEPFLEGCPCYDIAEDMKTGLATLDDLLAAGCPDLCEAAMKAEEATKDSILELGCPDPCIKDVWFAGCPCTVTLQDILNGNATVADLAPECGDICSGNPFFPTCPCDLDPFSKECNYCWNDPFAKGCPCADNPNDKACPVNLDDQFGACYWSNATCTEARCEISCAQSQGNGNSCTLWYGSYSRDPDVIRSFERSANKNPSWFASGTYKLGEKDASNITAVIPKGANPSVYWLGFEDDGKGCNKSPCSGSTFAVPIAYGGSDCDVDGRNCKCKSGEPVYYCYDDRYLCRKDANGNFLGLYRRGSDAQGNVVGGGGKK